MILSLLEFQDPDDFPIGAGGVQWSRQKIMISKNPKKTRKIENFRFLDLPQLYSPTFLKPPHLLESRLESERRWGKVISQFERWNYEFSTTGGARGFGCSGCSFFSLISRGHSKFGETTKIRWDNQVPAIQIHVWDGKVTWMSPFIDGMTPRNGAKHHYIMSRFVCHDSVMIAWLSRLQNCMTLNFLVRSVCFSKYCMTLCSIT